MLKLVVDFYKYLALGMENSLVCKNKQMTKKILFCENKSSDTKKRFSETVRVLNLLTK